MRDCSDSGFSIARLCADWLNRNPAKLIGVILIAAGCPGLIYGGFSYTKESTAVTPGPIELKVQKMVTVIVPLIVNAAAVVGVCACWSASDASHRPADRVMSAPGLQNDVGASRTCACVDIDTDVVY